jgi:hypothetical protein
VNRAFTGSFETAAFGSSRWTFACRTYSSRVEPKGQAIERRLGGVVGSCRWIRKRSCELRAHSEPTDARRLGYPDTTTLHFQPVLSMERIGIAPMTSGLQSYSGRGDLPPTCGDERQQPCGCTCRPGSAHRTSDASGVSSLWARIGPPDRAASAPKHRVQLPAASLRLRGSRRDSPGRDVPGKAGARLRVRPDADRASIRSMIGPEDPVVSFAGKWLGAYRG